MQCTYCSKENPDRNYYCYWCGSDLKERKPEKCKKRYERGDYILKLEIIEDDKLDKCFFEPYISKKKRVN